MRHLKRFRALALTCAFIMSSCLVPSYGCGGSLGSLIHDVATVVADVTSALDQAEAVANGPNVPAEIRTTALDLIAKARETRDVVQAAARAAESANDGDYVAAVTQLLATYDELTELLNELGLRQAPIALRSRLGAAPAGVRLVPTTAELRAEFMRDRP